MREGFMVERVAGFTVGGMKGFGHPGFQGSFRHYGMHGGFNHHGFHGTFGYYGYPFYAYPSYGYPYYGSPAYPYPHPTAHAMPLIGTAVAWAMHLTAVTLRTEQANVSLQLLEVGPYRIERLGPCNPLSPYFSS